MPLQPVVLPLCTACPFSACFQTTPENAFSPWHLTLCECFCVVLCILYPCQCPWSASRPFLWPFKMDCTAQSSKGFCRISTWQFWHQFDCNLQFRVSWRMQGGDCALVQWSPPPLPPSSWVVSVFAMDTKAVSGTWANIWSAHVLTALMSHSVLNGVQTGRDQVCFPNCF